MGMLIDAMDSSEPVPMAGVIALQAIDSQLPMDEDQRIPLAALAARELALAFAADDDSPGRLNSQRLDLMVWAVAGVARMSEDRREMGRRLVGTCATAIQFSTLRSVAHDLDEIRDLLRVSRPTRCGSPWPRCDRSCCRRGQMSPSCTPTWTPRPRRSPRTSSVESTNFYASVNKRQDLKCWTRCAAERHHWIRRPSPDTPSRSSCFSTGSRQRWSFAILERTLGGGLRRTA